jgi:uncharacterized protein
MVIDFHVHCFPEEIAGRAVTALAEKSNIPPRSDGTVAGIRASMKKAGIDKSVMLSIATKPQQTQKITQWAQSVQDEGIIAFGSIHPDCADWKDEIKRICEADLKGIKFHPEYQDFYVDDPKLFPIYEKAVEMGLIIMFHAGADLGFQPPVHCPPPRLRKVVKAFPGAKIVAAHMGGYDSWDDVERYLAGEQLYIDTSFSLHKMSREQFDRIVGVHGFERLLFATDSPWKDQSEEIELLKSLNLPDDVLQAISGGNAAKLLGLTC